MSCPICGRDADPRYRPFCSRRCADVDLGKWLTGGYALPATEDEPDLDAEGGAEAGASDDADEFGGTMPPRRPH